MDQRRLLALTHLQRERDEARLSQTLADARAAESAVAQWSKCLSASAEQAPDQGLRVVGGDAAWRGYVLRKRGEALRVLALRKAETLEARRKLQQSAGRDLAVQTLQKKYFAAEKKRRLAQKTAADEAAVLLHAHLKGRAGRV